MPNTHTHTRRDERTNTPVPTYTAAPMARAGGFCASAIRHRLTPLHEAAGNGHAALAAELLAHGADVDAKSNRGCGRPYRGGRHVCAHTYLHMCMKKNTCLLSYLHARLHSYPHACMHAYLTHTRTPAHARARTHARSHLHGCADGRAL